VLVHLVLLQGRVASFTGKYHHLLFNRLVSERLVNNILWIIYN
jgi:hypothetical protein